MAIGDILEVSDIQELKKGSVYYFDYKVVDEPNSPSVQGFKISINAENKGTLEVKDVKYNKDKRILTVSMKYTLSAGFSLTAKGIQLLISKYLKASGIYGEFLQSYNIETGTILQKMGKELTTATIETAEVLGESISKILKPNIMIIAVILVIAVAGLIVYTTIMTKGS